ncbi:response regulator [bacterium]|nr:response regulator [bacterium]
MRPEDKTILTVDDTPANIRLLTHYLQKQGYRVITAEDGFEGFKAAIQYHPDLVLLDIMMPGTDGYEVCELLKAEEETKDIPVVFLTAKADVEDKIKGFELGAVDYITKPFNLVEIATRVETQLNLKYLQEQNALYQEAIHDTRRFINLGVVGDAVIQNIQYNLEDPLKNLERIAKRSESVKINRNEIDAAFKSVEAIDSTVKKAIELKKQLETKRETINIHSVIQTVLDLIDEESDHSTSIEYTRSDTKWLVNGNFSLLQQAVYNILSSLPIDKNGESISVQIETSTLTKDLVKRLKKDEKTAKSYVRIDVVRENGEGDGMVDTEANLFIESKKKKCPDLELSATLNIVREHGGVFDIQNGQQKKVVVSLYLPMVQS